VACAALLSSDPGPLVVPALVLAEVAHFIERRLGTRVELRFLEDLAAGAFVVEPPRAPDWIRVAELVARYADARLGMVDASVVAAAERLGITRIATLDRRHFGIVRPAHVDLFDVVP
jgi:hypothetical protein